MKYYPILLRVEARPCVVIGGGTVAAHKVDALLRAGARVTVISPEVTPTLAALAAARRITHVARPYASGDLTGFRLAYAATDDEQLHALIAREADAAGVLLNVVDRPQLCHFIMPSVMQRGDLIIATSTSGTSPALAKRIRRDLERTFGPEYDLALQVLGRVRQWLARQSLPPAERQRVCAALAESPLLGHLRAGRSRDVDQLLAATVGGGVSLATLGLEVT